MEEFSLDINDKIHEVKMPKGAKLLRFDVLEGENVNLRIRSIE
jgi:hypothetical protein